MGGTSHKTEYTYRIYKPDNFGEAADLVKIVYSWNGFRDFWKDTTLTAVLVEKTANVHEMKTSPNGNTKRGLVVPKKTKKISIRTPQGAANPRTCSTVVDKNLKNANGVIPLNIQEFFGKTNQR